MFHASTDLYSLVLFLFFLFSSLTWKCFCPVEHKESTTLPPKSVDIALFMELLFKVLRFIRFDLNTLMCPVLRFMFLAYETLTVFSFQPTDPENFFILSFWDIGYDCWRGYFLTLSNLMKLSFLIEYVTCLLWCKLQ